MKAQPKSSSLPYSAGLSFLRQGKEDEAKALLKHAAELGKTNAHYWYVYGLALEKSDVLEASKALQTAFKVGGNPQHLYAQCEVLARNHKKGAVAFAFDRCL
ncbi:tetratricopeptide repeat protein, partial [Vibrio diabolicus]